MGGLDKSLECGCVWATATTTTAVSLCYSGCFILHPTILLSHWQFRHKVLLPLTSLLVSTASAVAHSRSGDGSLSRSSLGSSEDVLDHFDSGGRVTSPAKFGHELATVVQGASPILSCTFLLTVWTDGWRSRDI